MRNSTFRKHERGMALIIALLLLLLVSAVGLGMIYMSTTETSINANYKDTQTAFFAMRAGLEEMRDRIRGNSPNTIAVPTTMPGTANSIYYIINPSSNTEVVDPKTFNNAYFDDEFCHESFVGSGVTYVVPGTPCPSAGAPPAGSIATYINSTSPYTATAASLKYKWARITLKQNGTFPNALVDPTQTGLNLASQVCWDASLLQERVASAMGYGSCLLAKNAGLNVEPIYLVTAMAITPQGSRRVGQYEIGAFNVVPPPAGLAFDGPGATFNNAPNSNNFGINGVNSGDPANIGTYVPFTGPGGQAACTSTTPASVPAITTGDAAGASNINGSIPSNRDGNYTGLTPIPPAPASPDIQNEGTGNSSYPSNNALGSTSQWSTPAQLNAYAAEMANMANQTLNCGINGVGGAACSGSFGTDAAPKITFVNGDLNLTSGAGILVVTGTLSISGNSSFDGLVLVIGQGILNVNGGGHGQFNGSLLIANTNSQTAPFAQLNVLGPPTMSWNGGGTNFIQYNSCWSDYGSIMQYSVVASREEMY